MAKRNKNAVMLDHGTIGNHDERQTAVQSRPAVRVECPSEGAVIAGPSYTLQVAAMPGAHGVEVSIDQGDWMACREALGLWWYDWSGFDLGDHEVAARTQMGAGLSNVSAPRRFSVE